MSIDRNAPRGLLLVAALAFAATAQARTPSAPPHAPAKAAPTGAASATGGPGAAPAAAGITGVAPPAPPAVRDSARGDMTLRGGQDGTVFKTLTVEGEDRIHIELERPTLTLDVDPAKAPGLDWGSARDVLDRTTPDLAAPLLAQSAHETSPYLARPWLARFASGPVATFQPDVKGVESWKLSVVDARAQVVASFQGRGEPPHALAWDGRLASGGTLTPGATYSYVLEARDKAGNKRNFVGEGFRVSAVRFDGPGGPALAFAGRELDARAGATPVLLLEAASCINQWPEASRGVRIEATARSSDEANALAQRVASTLAPALVGDPTRVQSVTTVAPDAPEGGAVRITPGR